MLLGISYFITVICSVCMIAGHSAYCGMSSQDITYLLWLSLINYTHVKSYEYLLWVLKHILEYLFIYLYIMDFTCDKINS